MPRDGEWERQEREKWLQTQREAKEIEAGSFICPWCQRYVDPGAWWTHIDANPYEDVDGFGPTHFHRRCGARVPDKNKEWVAALRKRYDQSSIKPGDYVRLKEGVLKGAKSQLFRVIDIETDEYNGITENNPYYVLDISETDPRYQSYQARKREIEFVDRPFLKK